MKPTSQEQKCRRVLEPRPQCLVLSMFGAVSAVSHGNAMQIANLFVEVAGAAGRSYGTLPDQDRKH